MKVIPLIFTGVRGSYVTGPNGNCIFLPFAGSRGGDYHYGFFWSGTYDGDYDGWGGSLCSIWAYDLYCSKDSGLREITPRPYALSVRPVTEK